MQVRRALLAVAVRAEAWGVRAAATHSPRRRKEGGSAAIALLEYKHTLEKRSSATEDSSEARKSRTRRS